MSLIMSCCHRLLFSMVVSLCVLLGACSGSSGEESAGHSGALTEPPGADDEPLREAPELNNAIGFEIFREPHVRLPVPPETSATADQLQFDAGLPSPVITVPPEFDVNLNRAPFFSNLQNLDVLAGDVVSIRFDPEDPDGDLPGMFPEKLPLGASFTDNFDGSKTFRWQPLQEDVGIYRLTVVAVDASEPAYQSAQAVLIRISLPDDLSSIPNVAPMLQTLRAYTVRVNDSVVIELKGLDLNGTVPSLEITEAPVGATFVQHPRLEEVFVLKFTPTTTGAFPIDVTVRDSVNKSLTSVETISVTVLDAQSFEGDGIALKVSGQNHDLRIGFAALQSFYHQPDGVVYAEIAAREFNIVTPENSMKMDTINPLPGQYEFAATDNLVRYATANDMTVHGHPLVWYRQLPLWIQQSELADREQHMRDYIRRIMERYKSDIDIWDVINEPMADDGSLRSDESIWFQAMGEQYIDKALQQARAIAPEATLLINEFDISMAGPRFDGLVGLVKRLQARNTPLDGIGFQMHLFSGFSSFEALKDNFDTIASLGLDIYITELDVSISGEGDPSTEALLQQAEVYRQVTEICIAQVRCKALQMWGFTDQYSFRSNFNPLPFDRAYQRKPAYRAIQTALEGSTQ